MKKSKIVIRNIEVFAVNDSKKPGFDIFLEFSGQRVFLTHHRHSGLLYQLIEDGMRLDELHRFKPIWSHSHSKYTRKKKNQRSTRLEKMVKFLLSTIDEYIKECEIVGKTKKRKIKSHDYTLQNIDNEMLWKNKWAA